MAYQFRFYRMGGLDQVALENGEDLAHLHELDQKLWVALSCPVKGLELEERTLELLDLDKDGRVRALEILSAIAWCKERLKTSACSFPRRTGWLSPPSTGRSLRARPCSVRRGTSSSMPASRTRRSSPLPTSPT